MEFISNVLLSVACVIYIADNWQQVKNTFTRNRPGS